MTCLLYLSIVLFICKAALCLIYVEAFNGETFFCNQAFKNWDLDLSANILVIGFHL